MALELIANENADIDIYDPAETKSGVITVTTPASVKNKADGAGVYSGDLAFTASACTDGTCGSATGGGAIPPTAIKTKADGKEVIREGDNIDINVVGTLIADPSTACNFNINVKVKDAGQDSARAQ